MIIHFICGGNTYRSRLAEAYLNSKHLSNIKSISSGVRATPNESGPISWYAQRILQNEKLVPFESLGWQQTTKGILKQGDFTVFMQQEPYDYCRKKLGFTQKNYEIWVIKDIYEFLSSSTRKRPATEMEKIEASEETFKIIKRKIDDLINRFSKKHNKF
jgi:protein-tyrosine-phosphatase